MNVVRAGEALPQDFSTGYVIPVKKPVGWTSFDVVAKVRRIVGRAKIGHAGTLDPLADGLLVLCTGKATRLVETLQAQKKTYEGTYRFGAVTATDDADAPEENVCDVRHITRADVEAALAQLCGEIFQLPPAFSALKKNGKRAYELARKGLDPRLEPRPVTVYRHEILDFSSPERVRVVVECSKGTYIRALARDAGRILGVGAYLSALTRTQSGELKLDCAWEIDELVKPTRTSASAH